MNDGPATTPDPPDDATSDESSLSDDSSTSAKRRQLPPWLVPLLIGLVTITAGVFTWRAGQLASSSAYEDRQAVGQTIKQQQQRVEAGLATVSDAVAYVDYAADFAEAAALDSVAAEVAAQGLTEAAALVENEADALRLSATLQAEAAGVFGTQAVLSQSVTAPDEPIPFSVDDQLRANEAALSTGIAAPGVLDPDSWAQAAEDTRQRVRLLRWQTLLLLISVMAFTIAELTDRHLTRRTGIGVGLAIYVFVTVGTFLGSF